MKLRIQGNSLRLRLKQGEVAQLAEDGRVADRVELGPAGGLTYGLEVADRAEIGVRHGDGELIVELPRAEADAWTSTDRVGLAADLPVTADRRLRVLVEKDFACLHRRPGEDESDNYPHPAAG